MLYTLVPGYVFLAVAQTLCGAVRGAGRATVPMDFLIGNMCDARRMLWIALVIPFWHSILVVFLGYTLTWITCAVCMVAYCQKAN